LTIARVMRLGETPGILELARIFHHTDTIHPIREKDNGLGSHGAWFNSSTVGTKIRVTAAT